MNTRPVSFGSAWVINENVSSRIGGLRGLHPFAYAGTGSRIDTFTLRHNGQEKQVTVFTCPDILDSIVEPIVGTATSAVPELKGNEGKKGKNEKITIEEAAALRHPNSGDEGDRADYAAIVNNYDQDVIDHPVTRYKGSLHQLGKGWYNGPQQTVVRRHSSGLFTVLPPVARPQAKPALSDAEAQALSERLFAWANQD